MYSLLLLFSHSIKGSLYITTPVYVLAFGPPVNNSCSFLTQISACFFENNVHVDAVLTDI
jgi:hypothetical protein